MVEGVFPKATGDVFFASEANRFARAGGFIDAGSSFPSVGSSTNGIIAGSFVIAAGSLSEVSVIKIYANTSRINRTGAEAGIVRYQYSGTDFGADRTIGVASTLKERIFSESHAILSPFNSQITTQAYDTVDTNFLAVVENVNFTSYPASGLVIFILLKHNDPGQSKTLQNAIITFERSTFSL